MNDQAALSDTLQVAQWLDDLAATDVAIDGITALGHQAIIPLASYLDRGPQPISQSRVLAVDMLARLHDSRVPDVLRHVLRSNPLHALSPAVIESEFRVKDAALTALVTQQGAATPEDIAWSVQSERLPSGVRASGALRRTELIPSLIDLLEDDVLAEPAQEALQTLMPDSLQPTLVAIRKWMHADIDTVRTRLALVRAFYWLSATDHRVIGNMLSEALGHPSSAVRSAAALTAHEPANQKVLHALLHGALGKDSRIAQACRVRLLEVHDALVEPGLEVLRVDSEQDIYGNLTSADPAARYWLVTRLLQLSRDNISRLQKMIDTVPNDDLIGGLLRWESPSVISLSLFTNHASAQVRKAAAVAAKELGTMNSPRWLVVHLRDPDRHVRRQVYETLARAVIARRIRVRSTDFPWQAWCRQPMRCIRLLLRSQRL